MRARDFQRSKVYSSERSLHEAGELLTLEECQRIVDKITYSAWWAKRYGRIVSVTVKDGRGRRRAGAWADKIALPRWARKRSVICHELAHVAIRILQDPRKVPAHGIRYCEAYLEIVKRWMGQETHDDLRQSFLDGGVKFRGHEGWRPETKQGRKAV